MLRNRCEVFGNGNSQLRYFRAEGKILLLLVFEGVFCMPYTIVLAPPSSQMQRYVEAAQAYAKDQVGYLLRNDSSSSPHITVVQFEATAEKGRQIWDELSRCIDDSGLKRAIIPEFTGTAFVTGKGLYTGSTWVELSCARSKPIMHMHTIAVEVLKRFAVKPLNAVDDLYRPHLTLARTKLLQSAPLTNENFDDPGEFQVQFGRSDSEWQYAEKLAALSI